MVKKIVLAFVSLFVVCLLIGGVGIYFLNSQHKKLGSGELIMKEDKVYTIPFYYSSSGHILIDVEVEGSKEKYPFILDSGASNFIFKNHSSEFDLESNGRALGYGSTGNFFLSKIKKVDAIKINDIAFTNLNFEELDFNFNCLDHIYGLIGNGTMKHLNWQIDFEKKEIKVSKKLEQLDFSEDKIELPLRRNSSSNHLYTSLQFSKNKKFKSVLVDLGSSGTLCLKEKQLVKDSLNFQEKKILGKPSEGLGGESKEVNNERMILADSLLFKNSDFSITNVPVRVTSNGLSLLGLGFFKKYKTTISWSEKKLILEPYNAVQNFNWRTVGFGLKYKKDLDKIIVKSVTEETPANKLGVSVNAEVMELNGKKVKSESDLCDFFSLKTLPDTLQVKLKQGTKIQELQVPVLSVFK